MVWPWCLTALAAHGTNMPCYPARSTHRVIWPGRVVRAMAIECADAPARSGAQTSGVEYPCTRPTVFPRRCGPPPASSPCSPALHFCAWRGAAARKLYVSPGRWRGWPSLQAVPRFRGPGLGRSEARLRCWHSRYWPMLSWRRASSCAIRLGGRSEAWRLSRRADQGDGRGGLQRLCLPSFLPASRQWASASRSPSPRQSARPTGS